MKKYLLSLFAVLICVSSYGQVIRFTDTSNKWMEHAEEEVPLNYYYTGDTIINGLNYIKTNYMYCVREDVAAKKVYARLMVPAFFTDTIEHVLYDYSLQIGDTLQNIVDNDTLNSYVTDIDSFNYNNQWYKLWSFSMNGHFGYGVAEGIGSVSHLFTPINPGVWFGGLPVLRCFSNNGNHPVTSLLPYLNDGVVCALSVKDGVLEENKISIPNPATTNTTINIPQVYHNGHMLIYDAIGRKCAHIRLSDGVDVPFAGGLTTAGVYYFVIASADNKYSQRGAFIFAP